MLKPALEEYKLLRTDLAEIRNQITQYMGFIITIIGGAGVIAKAFFDQPDNAIGVVLVSFITMVVATLLFEIIWYKFDSHNRHAGYIQMLSHEIGYGPIAIVDEGSGKKEYLDTLLADYYERRKGEDDKMITFITNLNDVHSWELVLSRYRGSLHPGKEQSYRQLEKARYAYALGHSLKYSDFRDGAGDLLNINKSGNRVDYDISFYEEIISCMTTPPNDGFLKRAWIGMKTLYRRSPAVGLYKRKEGKLLRGYHFLGWTYPRKLTQIGLTGMILMFFFSCYEAFRHHSVIMHPDRSFSLLLTIENGVLLTGLTMLMLVWFSRYAYGIIDLESRCKSIDYYCWKLLPFRVQFLNGRGIIPLYFSRDFIRFMKSRRLLHTVEAMSPSANSATTKGTCKYCNERVGDFVSSTHAMSLCRGCRDDLSMHYRDHLEFGTPSLRRAHKDLVRLVFVQ